MQAFHFLAEIERLFHDLVVGEASSENVAHRVRFHF